MDPNRLNKAATDALTGNGVNAEMAYAMQALQLLTCRDPLTLAEAVKVMGREPDRLTNDPFGTVAAWSENKQWVCDLSFSKDFVRLRQAGLSSDNPTVGQFACLVLAAKMGEQA